MTTGATLPLRVRDHMTRALVTVAPETEITQVIHLLIEHDISGVLVVDGDGRLVGIVTERDCIAIAADAGYFDEWGGPARDFMSTDLETVDADSSLVDLAVRMKDSRFRRFPVLDEGALVGVISRRDVLQALRSGAWFKGSEGST